MSHLGQTRSFGDVGSSVRFARKRTTAGTIYECLAQQYCQGVRTIQTGMDHQTVRPEPEPNGDGGRGSGAPRPETRAGTLRRGGAARRDAED